MWSRHEGGNETTQEDREQDEERSLHVSVRLEGDMEKSLETDDLADTIDYIQVADMISQYCKTNKHSLLEHLGAALIAHCFEIEQIHYVWIKISKSYLSLELDAVGVEMEERR